jgi:ATP-dependent DNA helicase RecG
MLVMTATPIPAPSRSPDSGTSTPSYLRERPYGDVASRSPDASSSTAAHRDEAYDAVRSAVGTGRQAYVVCPLVDESDAIQARSAMKEAERLATEVFSRSPGRCADRQDEACRADSA